MATKKNDATPTVIVRTVAKHGRPAGPGKAKQEAFTALDTLMAGPKVTLEDRDDAGTVLRTREGVMVNPADVGKPATYTGLNALIGDWARDRGLSVSALAVDDSPARFITTK